MLYECIKVLHILAIISWMAGLLYLPRLFVYHVEAPLGSAQSQTFKIMERRLLKAIMTPAMVVAWLTGLYLAWSAGFFRQGWFHGKLLAVVAMSAAHGYLAVCVKRFAGDMNTRSGVHFRVINEVPTLLMIVVVILVVIKPFG